MAHEFQDNSPLTPAERKAEFAKDRLSSTYHEHAQAEATAIGGRFSQTERYTMAAAPPRIEGHSPSTDPINAVLNSVPDQLGYDINQQPVNGDTLAESLGMTEEPAPGRKGKGR